jgi:hypothetical protein
MNRNENILIVLLATVAVVLGAMLFVSYTEKQAYADASARSANSDYIITTAAMTDTLDLVYVFHVPSQKLMVYVPNAAKDTLEPASNAIDLKRIFAR